MGRGGRGFLETWHDRSLDLPDGTLRWMVVDTPGGDPFVAYFRLDGVGGLHWTIGKRLLAEHGHPDADLSCLGDKPSRPLTGPPPMRDVL